MLVLPTAYFGDVYYYFQITNAERICIETQEHFIKQSIRSTTNILTANGVQKLTVPVLNKSEKKPIKELRISYREPWQRVHWQAIKSAYGNAPYFVHYEPYIMALYEKKYEFLFDLNEEIRKVLFKLLKLNTEISYSEEYNSELIPYLYRSKKSEKPEVNFRSYTQVFSDRFPFQNNLSILDLLFNCGPKGLDKDLAV